VSNSEEVKKLAKIHNSDKKVFALGIGSSVDRSLVKGLARAGKGTSEFTSEGEQIAPKVIKQLRNILEPNLNNAKIYWGSPFDNANSSQAPSEIPPLYNGNRAQIFKLLDKYDEVPKKIRIAAENYVGEADYAEVISVDESNLKDNLLHKMFARKKIEEVTERKYEGLDPKYVRRTVTRLALKYQLMSEYTSFVAIDSTSNKASLAMESRSIFNQRPIDFDDYDASQYGPAIGGFSSYDDEEYDYSNDADTPTSRLDSIIRLQNTKGHFSKSQDMFEALELTEDDVENIRGDTDEKTFYTLLVLRAFEQRFKDLQPSWVLVGKKAEKFLAQQKFPMPLEQKIIDLLQKKN